MKIELSCAKCGSNRFDYPLVLSSDSLIICDDCGHKVGTVAEMQEKVLRQLAEAKSERK